MKTVSMILKGNISSCSDRTYLNKSRPSAKYADGMTVCEVFLEDENSTINNIPQRAELHFMHIVKFENGVGEIDLYDGPKLAMKFWPTLSLAEN
jgi:hypothetical protein